MSNDESSRGTFFDDLKPSDVMQMDVFANPSPAHRVMNATAFSKDAATASVKMSEKEHDAKPAKPKPGFKFDPETGEEVPLTEEELRVQKLQ